MLRAILLCAPLVASFEVTSGNCRLDKTRPLFMIVPRWTPFCVYQPKNAGSCTIEPPDGLPLRVYEFDVTSGSLLVDGVEYRGTDGPVDIKPSGLIQWDGNGTTTDDWKLCRPVVPEWLDWVTVILLTAIMGWIILLFLLQHLYVYLVALAALSGFAVAIILTIVLRYDGYTCASPSRAARVAP